MVEGRAEVALDDDEGKMSICLKSVQSSFSIQRKTDIDLDHYPVIRWTWKAKELPIEGDVRNSDRNDQAAQLFVGFKSTKIFGIPLGAQAISYVWDSNAPIDTVEYEDWSFMGVGITLAVLVVRSGNEGVDDWITLERNVQDDYDRLFGGEPPSVSVMRFQANSQHTSSSAESCIRALGMQSAASPN